VRARPDSRLAAPSEQVPRLVARDLEPRLGHPSGCQFVRLVLRRRVADAVADRRNPLYALEDLQEA
jgi:hypothetical protein